MSRAYAAAAAGSPPGTAAAETYVAVAWTLAAVSVERALVAAPGAAALPTEAAAAEALFSPLVMSVSWLMISTGRSVGWSKSDFTAAEAFSTPAAAPAGKARQTGRPPMFTSGLPGPGVRGAP